MAGDVHRGFAQANRIDPREVADFLLAADQLAGVRRVRQAMARCLPAPRAGRTLVDVGCGPGWETERLAAARSPERVIGVDHNPAMIAAARARVPVGGPEWLCADLCAIELPPGTVDLIRAERVLMYVPDLPRAVDRLVDLLRPGGRLVSFELDYGATLLALGRARVDIVRRVVTMLESTLPHPLAGRRLPGLLHDHDLTVTAEPHVLAIDHTVWQWIVRDTVRQAIRDGHADPEGIEEWLTELDAPVFATFRAAFTGVLTTASRL